MFSNVFETKYLILNHVAINLSLISKNNMKHFLMHINTFYNYEMDQL